MAITAKQAKERKKYIGSSEAAALLGLSPWKNAYDLWLEKTGQVEVDELTLPGAAQDGLLFESGILRWASKTLGNLIIDPAKLQFKHPNIKLISHPDAILTATGSPVEVKTSGLRGPLPPGWGEPGTDQVPDYYIIQAQVHMMCMQKRLCHMPVYLGGRGPAMFLVKENESLQALLCDGVKLFWKHVKEASPPPDTIPHLDTVKRMIREPGLLTVVDLRLIDNVRQAREVAKEAGQHKALAEAELLAALGDAEGTEDGLVTYLQQGRTGLDGKRIKEEAPEMWEKYKRETRFRVLRLKKGAS